MKKQVIYHPRAEKELFEFPDDVKYDFLSLINILQERGRLSGPDAKKVDRGIFEMRVLRSGSYRGFYAYIVDDKVVVLNFFHKKTQKTPLDKLKLARQRLKEYV